MTTTIPCRTWSNCEYRHGMYEYFASILILENDTLIKLSASAYFAVNRAMWECNALNRNLVWPLYVICLMKYIVSWVGNWRAHSGIICHCLIFHWLEFNLTNLQVENGRRKRPALLFYFCILVSFLVGRMSHALRIQRIVLSRSRINEEPKECKWSRQRNMLHAARETLAAWHFCIS